MDLLIDLPKAPISSFILTMRNVNGVEVGMDKTMPDVLY